MNLNVQGAMRNRAWKAQGNVDKWLRHPRLSQPIKDPMRCSYSMEHIARTPLGQSHETHNSLIDSLKSHFRKERKGKHQCLKITVARSEAKKDS